MPSDTAVHQSVRLSELHRKPVVDTTGTTVGRFTDVIVALRGHQRPPVIGLVLHTGDHDVFVPAERIATLAKDRIELSAGPVAARPFERRDGEVLLRVDVLGHRLLDIARARLVRAYDIALSRGDGGGWVVSGVDVHRVGFWHLCRHAQHPTLDWTDFEALIGHQPSARARAPFARLRRLKPAQLADLLESADRGEQTEILDQVHADPELEADVFEELDDDEQSRLLAGRTDTEAAAVLARMRADDAADALLDLPQERRQSVLDVLPTDQRHKVITLLGYNETPAGGLMGVEYLTLPPRATAGEAVAAVRNATRQQQETLLSVYLTDDDGHLVGAVPLITTLRTDPATRLSELADDQPVFLYPEADIVDVTTRMADFNLITLPIVDHDHRLIGLITVDDALEAAIPENWRRRGPSTTTVAPSTPANAQ